MLPAPGFSLPRWLHVEPFGARSGAGEDDPVWSARLERDGWTRASCGRPRRSSNADVWIELDPPVVWEKRHPLAPDRYILRMAIRGVKEHNGPSYVTDHDLLSNGDPAQPLGRSDWAEWSPSGDLLFARDASLYRLPFTAGTLPPLPQARELIDLADRKFTNREAPPDA